MEKDFKGDTGSDDSIISDLTPSEESGSDFNMPGITPEKLALIKSLDRQLKSEENDDKIEAESKAETESESDSFELMTQPDNAAKSYAYAR